MRVSLTLMMHDLSAFYIEINTPIVFNSSIVNSSIVSIMVFNLEASLIAFRLDTTYYTTA